MIDSLQLGNPLHCYQTAEWLLSIYFKFGFAVSRVKWNVKSGISCIGYYYCSYPCVLWRKRLCTSSGLHVKMQVGAVPVWRMDILFLSPVCHLYKAMESSLPDNGVNSGYFLSVGSSLWEKNKNKKESIQLVCSLIFEQITTGGGFWESAHEQWQFT